MLAPVALVTVTLDPVSPIVGGTSNATAVTLDANSNVLTGRLVVWSSSDTTIATVDPATGVVTALATGTAEIIATSEGIAGQATIEVIPPVALVTVSLSVSSILPGSTSTASAVLSDEHFRILTGRPVAWSSTDPAVATVDPASGLVTGVAPGSTSIIATSEGVSGSAALVVIPPVATVNVALGAANLYVGSATTATAVTLDANSNVLLDRAVMWSSSDAAIATVDATTGLVTAVAPGAASIIAISETITGQSALTVTLAPVASVEVTLGATSIIAGAATAGTAVLRDTANHVLTGRPITWSSSEPTIASVDAGTGMVIGVAAGSALIVAESEGIADTVTVSVVTMGPTDPTLLPAATGQTPAPGTYGRDLEAGQTYVDPNTNVTVLKLTGASLPSDNPGVNHGYSEGGPSISQPWVGADGHVYYSIHMWHGWLVDVRYDTFEASNWRRAPSHGEISFAFSLNPATPRIAYVVTDFDGKRVDRYNTATNQIENTGRWPWIASAPGQFLAWLQTNVNDTWVVGFLNSNQTTVAFRPSDGLERSITTESTGQITNEPHLDREFPIVYLARGAGQPVAQQIVNLETGALTNPPDPLGINSDGHTATLRGRAVAVTFDGNGIVQTTRDGVVSMAVSPSPVDANGDSHLAGQWVFNNPSDYFVIDQWFRDVPHPIRQGMIGFVSPTTGDQRILVAHDAVGSSYETGGQPHPTISPDGKLVMWTTNMNGSPRFDVFVARVPTQ